jgi:thiamine biosynthesis lipoprotein ApbE
MIPTASALFLLPLLAPVHKDGVRIERRLTAMGTSLGVQVEAADRAAALEASEAVVRAVETVEARLSTWREDSELARLNGTPVGEAFELSPELARDLARTRSLWLETDGAFDPSVGAFVDAWDLRGAGRRPTEGELGAAAVAGGFGALELKGDVAVRRAANLRLEEGGFGKGVALDAALAALADSGARAATLDLGGQIAVFGTGESAAFGVADPRDRARSVLTLTIEAGSLATSGNSERGIVVDGEHLGHLLDPQTGRPVADFGSLTVWAPDATTADGLSTALYVLGPDAALAWADARDGVEVVVIQVEGDRLRARASAGWGDHAAVTAEDLILERPGRAGPAVVAAAAQGQGGQDTKRLDELERRIDVVAGEVERQEHGSILPPVGDSEYGMGPAASKVYQVGQGVSIGGYGEGIFSHKEGSATDRADFLRAVLYVGYRFDDNWVFNSEIEIEHASTSKSGSTSVEFAYIDYLASEQVNARAGIVLVPMGLTNEMHEPTTFPSAMRPGVESVIIPTPWRETGAGVFGSLGDFDYNAYLVNGLDAQGFKAGGLRSGRQKGSKAKADDWAGVLAGDWNVVPGVSVGGSAYYGDSAQDLSGIDVPTTIFEAHADVRWRNWRVRALHAQAMLDDVTELNTALGLGGSASVGEELEGHYIELGCDVMSWLRPETGQSLMPFVRWEEYDTQAEVPAGFLSDPANDVEILTAGIAWQPNAQIIFKLDFMDVDNGAGTGVDQINVALGYVF